MSKAPHEFDAHLYYTAATRASAATIQQSARTDLASVTIFVGHLIDRPVGPHPTPMFEIQFGRPDRAKVVGWLNAQRGSHTVLIHEVTGDDVADHTTGAEWLGAPVELDMTKFV